MDSKPCAHCGERIERSWHSNGQWANARFCSRRCNALARHAREAKSRPHKPCAQCGVEFAKNPRYNTDQWERARYCSRKCQAAAIRHPRAMCACGCGRQVSKPGSRFCQGHNPQPERVKVFQRNVGQSGKARWHVPARDGTRVQWARIVMRDELGRELLPGEVVHHVNGDSEDDRPENLQVFASHAEHMRHEYALGRTHRLH